MKILPTYLFNGNLTNKVVGDSSHPLMRHYYPDHYGARVKSKVYFITYVFTNFVFKCYFLWKKKEYIKAEFTCLTYGSVST